MKQQSEPTGETPQPATCNLVLADNTICCNPRGHDEGVHECKKGIQSVLFIRCMEHRSVPQYNTKESAGGECPACEIEPARAAAKRAGYGSGSLASVIDNLVMLCATAKSAHAPSDEEPNNYQRAHRWTDADLYDAYLLGCEDECVPEPLTKESFINKFWRSPK